ncbi:hypothetical protein HPB50_002004 [Hyalomma asiaticum]|uniref:Uncharacterized protein n=1 Tax=Hyalomma asiaticum TaxID=266040 RepID=A0ACB7RUU2_HYAAI|nr:hypothetical protein HPB50_002004 [Hyalomma asiaticum]
MPTSSKRYRILSPRSQESTPPTPAIKITLGKMLGYQQVRLSKAQRQAPLLSWLKLVVLQKLHLQNGIYLTKVQGIRITTHKKSTLVVKETAQAIWTLSGLAVWSLKGGLAPRKKGTAEVAKLRLTPEKVQVVAVIDHDSENDLKITHGVSAIHISTGHFTTMKVSIAVEFFREASPAIRYLIEKGLLPAEAEATTWFFELVPRWYALMSSRYPVLPLSKIDPYKYQGAGDTDACTGYTSTDEEGANSTLVTFLSRPSHVFLSCAQLS